LIKYSFLSIVLLAYRAVDEVTFGLDTAAAAGALLTDTDCFAGADEVVEITLFSSLNTFTDDRAHAIEQNRFVLLL
jgi:hypothetical protein